MKIFFNKLIYKYKMRLLLTLLVFVFNYSYAQINITPYHDLGVTILENEDTVSEIFYNVPYKELFGKKVLATAVSGCECTEAHITNYLSDNGYLSIIIRRGRGSIYQVVTVYFNNGEYFDITFVGSIK